MARPKAKIDWAVVDELLMYQASGVEIAEEFGINPETLYDACKRDHNIGFSEYSHQKRARGVCTARKVFFNECWIDKGEDRTRATKQIFWLKNYADMSDKQDVKLSGSLETKSSVIVRLPDNGRRSYSGAPTRPTD